MWKLIFFVAGLALVASGAQGIYTGMKNRKPVKLTCAQFEQRPSKKEWLELSDCVFRLEESAFAGSAKNVTKVFIPLVPVGADANARAAIVLESHSHELTNLMSEVERGRGVSGTTMIRARQLMQEPQNVSGLVRFGIELDDDEKSQLRALSKQLRADFVILRHDAKPSTKAAVGELVLGLLLAIGIALSFIGRRDEDA